MHLRHERLRVDDVLDDLGGDHDVERLVAVRESRRHLLAVVHVDLELVDVDPASLGLDAVRRVELQADELDALVAAEALEHQAARAAEIEDARAAEVACRLEQHAVRLRVPVLDVQEEALVQLPGRIEGQVEERPGHDPSIC